MKKEGFDLVHSVIPIAYTGKTFEWGRNECVLIGIYINKYGNEIGCLCRNLTNNKIMSMDPFLHEEFLNYGGVFE
jgi:hypothetical protein